MPKFKGGTSLVWGFNQADPGAGGNALDDGAGIPAERMALIQLESDGYITELFCIRVIVYVLTGSTAVTAIAAYDLGQFGTEIYSATHGDNYIIIAVGIHLEREIKTIIAECTGQLITGGNCYLHGDFVALLCYIILMVLSAL